MEFVENTEIVSDDFYYDLFEGGYIKPEQILKNKEDIDAVKNAIAVINRFRSSAEEKEVLIYS